MLDGPERPEGAEGARSVWTCEVQSCNRPAVELTDHPGRPESVTALCQSHLDEMREVFDDE